LRHNLHRQQARVRLFEVGTAFVPEAGGLQQLARIAGAVAGPCYPEQWGVDARAVDFHDLKADVEVLLAAGRGRVEFTADVHPALHPGQCASIKKDGRSIGWIGALHPARRRALDLETPVYVFELDLAALVPGARPAFAPVSRFPSVRRDLSVIVDTALRADDLLACVRRHASELLRELQLFDVYQGQGIESGKKSMALGLIFQASSSTLKDEDVDELTRAVVDGMRRELGATLRAE
jgi:phenylalanyl-tRNA synthetase beta chain